MADEWPILLRSKRDQATVRAATYTGDDDCSAPSADQWSDLRHGDLIYRKYQQFNTDVWIVVADEDGTRTLEDSGDIFWCLKIGAAITRHIKDPLRFYDNIITTTFCRRNIIIGFDARVHDRAIRASTGDRSVDQSCFIWWDSYRPYNDLRISGAPDYPCGWSVCLGKETPDEYLTGSDPELDRNHEDHEVNASEFFRELKPGDYVALSDFANDMTLGTGGVSGELLWVSPATGPVEQVGIKLCEIVCVFAQHRVVVDGPYRGVHVWAGVDAQGSLRMINFRL